MRETFLDNDLAHPVKLFEPEKILSIKRRQFLKTLGLISVGLTLPTEDGFAQDTEASSWLHLVTRLVYTVCGNDNEKARAINSQLYRANIMPAPGPTNFHTQFSARYIFTGTRISPERVLCGNGFEVNLFPLYSVEYPCGDACDLNSFEIGSLTHVAEIHKFGCVLAPTGPRTTMGYSDQADYRRTAAAYGLNPNSSIVNYKRIVSGRGKTRNIFGVTKADKNGKPVVGANGKPLRDVFISDTDI